MLRYSGREAIARAAGRTRPKTMLGGNRSTGDAMMGYRAPVSMFLVTVLNSQRFILSGSNGVLPLFHGRLLHLRKKTSPLQPERVVRYTSDG